MKRRKLRAYVGVVITDGIRPTSRVAPGDNKVALRGLFVHGLVFAREAPACIEDAVVMHALRPLRNWLSHAVTDKLEFAQYQTDYNAALV